MGGVDVGGVEAGKKEEEGKVLAVVEVVKDEGEEGEGDEEVDELVEAAPTLLSDIGTGEALAEWTAVPSGGQNSSLLLLLGILLPEELIWVRVEENDELFKEEEGAAGTHACDVMEDGRDWLEQEEAAR